MWDVTYWTYICVVFVGLFGDKAWWLWVVVPVYSVYAAWSTWTGMRGALGGGMEEDVTKAGGGSKRQAKLEKRGQRVAYR